jgi:outer membrane protein assembly factor BamB
MLASTLLLAAGLAAPRPAASLPPAPISLWSVRWTRDLVPKPTLEWKAQEPGGPGVDPATGVVVAGTRDGILHAVGPDNRLLWEFQGGAGFEAAPLIRDGVVYAGCGDGILYALELATGKERWRYDAKEEVGTTPVLAGGLIFFATLQDTLFAVDAKTGEWRWHHRRDPPSGFTIRGAAGAAVANGVVYAAYADGTVAALDAAVGSVRWERRVAPSGDFMDIDSTPQVSGSRVFVAAYSGAVYALDAATGVTAWEFRTPGASQLVLAGDRVVAVTTTQVLALSAGDGKQLWNTPFKGMPGGAPIVAAGYVLVPTGVGLLWLDLASGRSLRVADPGSGVTAAAAVRGGRVYLLSNQGQLYALEIS